MLELSGIRKASNIEILKLMTDEEKEEAARSSKIRVNISIHRSAGDCTRDPR
jgi:hypothetical protein